MPKAANLLMRLPKGKQIRRACRSGAPLYWRIASLTRRIAAKSSRRLCKTAKSIRRYLSDSIGPVKTQAGKTQ